MKRILYVANFKPGRGGISGQVECLMRNMCQEDGYYVDVFSTTGGLLRRIFCFFALIKRARRYDILHIHGCSYRGFLPIAYGVIVGKLLNKHIIITYHGGDAGLYFQKRRKWVRFWLLKADERIVLSGFLKAIFDAFMIPAQVIPNIVELPEVYVEKSELRPRFISVRHFRELYNIPCIIRAFERVQKQIPEASLTLLGEGDKRDELESMVIDANLKNVCFVGQVSNGEVGDYFKKNDFLLSSPRIDNMPVSLLEAFSSGLLVISSNVGGVPYMVEHGVTGLLFESDNDSEVAEQMLWALTNQEASLRMINKAKEEVGKYSWNKIRERILALYE